LKSRFKPGAGALEPSWASEVDATIHERSERARGFLGAHYELL
jgi:hypothetical protein